MKSGNKLISKLSWDYRSARVLQVANALDIFTFLSKGAASAEEIAAKCTSEPVLTEKLLIACAGMGLLEYRDGKYFNSEISQKYLVADSEFYQGDMIAHSTSVWEFWDDLPKQIGMKNPPIGVHGDAHRNFIMGMHNLAAAGRGEILLEKIDLSRRKRLFDAGGGPGTYSIMLCGKYPQLTAVVFDLPETIAIAKEMVQKANMEDRISLRAGDWDTDDFGIGNDAFLFSNVLHGPISNAEAKLRKAFNSMEKGGLLIIQEFLLNDEKSGPLIPALFNVMVGAYSENEFLQLVKKAGFGNAKIIASSKETGGTWLTAHKPFKTR